MKFASSKTARVFIFLVVILVMVVSKRSSYILRKKFLRYFRAISILGILIFPERGIQVNFRNHESSNRMEKWSMSWNDESTMPGLSRNMCVWYRTIIRQHGHFTLEKGNSTSMRIEARFAIKIDIGATFIFIYIPIDKFSCADLTQQLASTYNTARYCILHITN